MKTWMARVWRLGLALSALCLIWLLAVGSFAQDSPFTRVYSFDQDAAGKTPGGFTATLTKGGGETAVRWELVEAGDAISGRQVVGQLSSDTTRNRFPLLVLDDSSLKDIELSVKFKPISGTVDQAAGIVWRLKDNDNYLVVRANALENNVVVYKTVAGQRSSIGVRGNPQSYGVRAEVPANKWSTLRVRMIGDVGEVFLNDTKLFEIENNEFPAAGKVGLWTKADSVTHFDDFKVTSLDRP